MAARKTSKSNKKKTSSRKKASGSRKKSAPVGPTLTERIDDLFAFRHLPAVRAAAWVIFAGGLIAVAGWGIPRLEQRVSAATWAPTESVTIELIDRPAWVRDELLTRLDLTARTQLIDGDPLEGAELEDIRKALLDAGWYRSIEQVVRTAPDTIEVHGTWVVPTAVVRDRDGDHLVDHDGRLLPLTFDEGKAESQIPIVGAAGLRPNRPGDPWPGGDVACALSLIELLRDRAWTSQVRAVDVSADPGGRALVIVTDRGARILWGAAPGDEEPLEVPAADKLAYLNTAFSRFGRIDTGHSGVLRFSRRGYFVE